MIKQRDLYQQYPKGMESKSKEMNAKDTTIMHALYDAKDFMNDLTDEVMKLQTKHENRSAAASARASRKRQGGDASGASKKSRVAWMMDSLAFLFMIYDGSAPSGECYLEGATIPR